MGAQMENKNYLLIENGIAINVVIWNGDVNIWAPPSGTTALLQEITPAMVWVADETLKDYVLQEQIGAGAIGFTWNGSVLTTSEAKPEWPEQPVSEGTQTL